MKKELDLEKWSRKEHFEFFSKFDEPFFGVTVQIDCTNAYQEAKKNQYSFFLYYLHKSLAAANQIAPFSYRIIEGKVYEFDQVNAAPTINKPDNTFAFSYMDYHEDFTTFSDHANDIIEQVRNIKGLGPATDGENVIHFSALPWLNFTSVSHARHFKSGDSCPKISFGKMHMIGDKKMMPVSIHVHHALMDGYDVGMFVELFQELMDGGAT